MGFITQSFALLHIRGAEAPNPVPDTPPTEVEVADIISMEGDAFIKELYFTILRRPPDPDGFREFRNSLDMGISKLELIHNMAKSPEAKALGVKIAGLPRLLPFKRLIRRLFHL